MDSLSQIQIKILTGLIFNPKARFKELNSDNLGTDNFSYHIRSLTSGGLIVKQGPFYSLTTKGKMFAGKVDTATHTVEKQPKVSVILIPHKKIGGLQKYLVQERTKEPYFGYWGFMTGKVKFGETLQETALRELKEEAGVEGRIEFCYELHEMVYDKNTLEQLEDKFFHVLEVFDLCGDAVESTKEGVVKFVDAAEFKKLSPKYHNEQDIMDRYLKKDFLFKEEKYYIERF